MPKLPPFENVLNGDAKWGLWMGDAVACLRTLPEASVDLILTDHAYESVEKHRAIGTTTRLKVSEGSSNPWFPAFPDKRLMELLHECRRVLKKDRHAYFVLDFETLFTMKPLAGHFGFRFCNVIIWDKQATGMGWRWRERVQPILMLEQGTRQMRYKGWNNLIEAKRLRGEDFYPTQKPVELARTLIQNSTEPGEVVFDGFSGSGAFGVAALETGRRFVGGDLESVGVVTSFSALSEAEERFASIEDPPMKGDDAT